MKTPEPAADATQQIRPDAALPLAPRVPARNYLPPVRDASFRDLRTRRASARVTAFAARHPLRRVARHPLPHRPRALEGQGTSLLRPVLPPRTLLRPRREGPR